MTLLHFEWVQGEPPASFQQQLSRALVDDLDFVHAPVHSLVLPFIALDLDLVHNLARYHDQARNLAHNLDLDGVRDLDHDHVCALAHDLALALERACARDLDRARDLDYALAEELVRDFALARELYGVLSLLQERIEGIFPACEGILLVKERQQRNSGTDEK